MIFQLTKVSETSLYKSSTISPNCDKSKSTSCNRNKSKESKKEDKESKEKQSTFGIRCKGLREIVKEEIKSFKVPEIEELPVFTGGAVGYLSYETVSYFEDTVTKKKNYYWIT